MAEAIHVQTVGDYLVSTFPNGRFRENGYLVLHTPTKKALVIDPGGREEDFTATIERENAEIVGILLTHGHFDHVGAVHGLCARYEKPCHLDSRDRQLARQASLFGLRFANLRMRAPAPVEEILAPTQMQFAATPEIEVVHTPGHTPGSVSFVLPGMAFVGDLLFRELVGPTVYPGSDRAALLESIDRLLAELDPETILFAGHGRPWKAVEASAWRKTHRDPPAMKLFGEPHDAPPKAS